MPQEYFKLFFALFKVILMQDIEDEDAQKLVNKCPVNVFDIEDMGDGKKLGILFVYFFS